MVRQFTNVSGIRVAVDLYADHGNIINFEKLLVVGCGDSFMMVGVTFICKTLEN